MSFGSVLEKKITMYQYSITMIVLTPLQNLCHCKSLTPFKSMPQKEKSWFYGKISLLYASVLDRSLHSLIALKNLKNSLFCPPHLVNANFQVKFLGLARENSFQRFFPPLFSWLNRKICLLTFSSTAALLTVKLTNLEHLLSWMENCQLFIKIFHRWLFFP